MTEPRYCCDKLRARSTLTCGQHTDPFHCADVLLVWSAFRETWGCRSETGAARSSRSRSVRATGRGWPHSVRVLQRKATGPSLTPSRTRRTTNAGPPHAPSDRWPTSPTQPLPCPSSRRSSPTREETDVTEQPEITADTAAALGAVARVCARLAELDAAGATTTSEE